MNAADFLPLVSDDLRWLAMVTAGFKGTAHMKKDTDLDPLREREDFKKLIAELEIAAAKP